VRLSGHNGDANCHERESRTSSQTEVFGELVIALQSSTELAGHSVKPDLSRLVVHLIGELRQLIGDLEVKRAQLSARVLSANSPVLSVIDFAEYPGTYRIRAL
jgi:hypothetical protein